ncbi:hypothetical protein ACH5RR_032691 [Cinchona calisaya]|uniref:Uncharacterized protein n=1 Tax=Cinchona calisaya TaxID=153742 RepID=A0ABD2YN06_9GENT
MELGLGLEDFSANLSIKYFGTKVHTQDPHSSLQADPVAGPMFHPNILQRDVIDEDGGIAAANTFAFGFLSAPETTVDDDATWEVFVQATAANAARAVAVGVDAAQGPIISMANPHDVVNIGHDLVGGIAQEDIVDVAAAHELDVDAATPLKVNLADTHEYAIDNRQIDQVMPSYNELFKNSDGVVAAAVDNNQACPTAVQDNAASTCPSRPTSSPNNPSQIATVRGGGAAVKIKNAAVINNSTAGPRPSIEAQKVSALVVKI